MHERLICVSQSWTVTALLSCLYCVDYPCLHAQLRKGFWLTVTWAGDICSAQHQNPNEQTLTPEGKLGQNIIVFQSHNFRIKYIQEINRRAHVQTTADVLISRSTKQNACIWVDCYYVAVFVRADKDEFLWNYREPQPFETKYTEEELHVLEAEWKRREAEAVELPGAEEILRTCWWCRCGQKSSASAVLRWTWCCHDEEDSTQRDCITTNDASPALVNPAVDETFFRPPIHMWNRR